MHAQKMLASICLIPVLLVSESNAQRAEGEVSDFAENVLFHVVLHEVGHGLIREFDLPILGNEETMADAFATHYVTHHCPDRAYDVLHARISSLMIEANEVPQGEWPVTGEHNNDARRAHQIAALAVAADAEKFGPLAKELGMSESDINRAKDYGSEIHRSWRRTLRPLMMPDGMQSTEVRMRFDPSSNLVDELQSRTLVKDVQEAVARFDWHSQITISFMQGDGGAGWSRSQRAVTVYTEYVRRFIKQGEFLQQD